MPAGTLVTTLSIQGADAVEKELGDVVKKANKFQESMAKINLAGTGFKLLIKGISVFRNILADGAEELEKYQRSFKLLDLSLKEIGRSAGGIKLEAAVKQMEKLFDATLATKSEILTIQAAVGRTTTNTQVFEGAVQSALDLMAARESVSAEAAGQLITTILGDPRRTMEKLRRAEIQVSVEFENSMKRLVDSGKLVEAQLLTIDLLRERMAGAAQAAVDTPTGLRIQYEKQLGELKCLKK